LFFSSIFGVCVGCKLSSSSRHMPFELPYNYQYNIFVCNSFYMNIVSALLIQLLYMNLRIFVKLDGKIFGGCVGCKLSAGSHFMAS
jgi:hypothetical protein